MEIRESPHNKSTRLISKLQEICSRYGLQAVKSPVRVTMSRVDITGPVAIRASAELRNTIALGPHFSAFTETRSEHLNEEERLSRHLQLRALLEVFEQETGEPVTLLTRFEYLDDPARLTPQD